MVPDLIGCVWVIQEGRVKTHGQSLISGKREKNYASQASQLVEHPQIFPVPSNCLQPAAASTECHASVCALMKRKASAASVTP
eukprot:scaffold165250_cov20-Tisochrysis_lutea.AAC.5